MFVDIGDTCWYLEYLYIDLQKLLRPENTAWVELCFPWDPADECYYKQVMSIKTRHVLCERLLLTVVTYQSDLMYCMKKESLNAA